MKTNNNIKDVMGMFAISFINSFCQAYVFSCAGIAIAKKVKEKRLLKERAAIGNK